MTALRLVKQDDTPNVDLETEIALLGSILIDPHAIDRLSLQLKPEHFGLDMHQVIYRTMLTLGDAGAPPNLTLVYSALMQNGDLERVGGMGYLASLWRIEASSVYVDHYARAVIDLAKRRRIAEVQSSIAGADQDELPVLEEELHDAMRDGATKTELVGLESGFTAQNERLDRQMAGEKPPRWTGLRALDDKLMRWEKGDLIIVGALTGEGKTAFALGVAYHLLKHEGKRVAFFSLEMSDIQIADRLVGLDASIPVERIQDGEFTADEMDRYAVAQGRLASMSIRASYDAAVTVRDVRRKVEREHKLQPFDLIIVDYLGLMTGAGENRTQEVSKMASGLKALAMSLQCPILAPHQLNRGADESRKLKLSDLKDSSTIEQSANTVLLLQHDEADPATVYVDIPKNRQRKKGNVVLHWEGPLMKFTDIARNDYGSSAR